MGRYRLPKQRAVFQLNRNRRAGSRRSRVRGLDPDSRRQTSRRGALPSARGAGTSAARLGGLELAHRQQAVGRDTFVGHDTEQLAGRQAGIFHQHLEIVTRGETLTQLPGADRGNGNAQVHGDLLKRNLVLPSPVAKGGGKADADVAMKLGLPSHTRSLRRISQTIKPLNGEDKLLLSPPKRRRDRLLGTCALARL